MPVSAQVRRGSSNGGAEQGERGHHRGPQAAVRGGRHGGAHMYTRAHRRRNLRERPGPAMHAGGDRGPHVAGPRLGAATSAAAKALPSGGDRGPHVAGPRLGAATSAAAKALPSGGDRGPHVAGLLERDGISFI